MGSSQRTRQQESKRRRIRLIAALVAVFLGVTLTAQLTREHDPAANPATSASAGGAKPGEHPIVRRDNSDPAAIGDANAPVVLVQWTDMRCPFCAVFSRETLPVLRREYVDTGKVRIEVRDVAFFGDESENAAVAARAAGRQGRYFAFMQAVYAEAPEHGRPELPREELIAFAAKAGVPDIARFTADLDDAGLHAAARVSTTEAGQLGVTTVPFFVAGAKSLSGAQPVAVFRQYLNAAIIAAG